MSTIGQFSETRVFVELHGPSQAEIEIEDIDRAKPGKVAELAKQCVAQAVSLLSDAVAEAGKQEHVPNEAELEVGFNLTAESNVVFVKGSTNATFRLRVKWLNDCTERVIGSQCRDERAAASGGLFGCMFLWSLLLLLLLRSWQALDEGLYWCPAVHAAAAD